MFSMGDPDYLALYLPIQQLFLKCRLDYSQRQYSNFHLVQAQIQCVALGTIEMFQLTLPNK